MHQAEHRKRYGFGCDAQFDLFSRAATRITPRPGVYRKQSLTEPFDGCQRRGCITKMS